MRKFAELFPEAEFVQASPAQLSEAEFVHASRAQLQETEFLQLPLTQITWYHHCALNLKTPFLLKRVATFLLLCYIISRLRE
jgi:hypothetical protein